VVFFWSGRLSGRRTSGFSRVGRTPGGGDTGFRRMGAAKRQRREAFLAQDARAGRDIEARARGLPQVGCRTRAGRQRMRRGRSVFSCTGRRGHKVGRKPGRRLCSSRTRAGGRRPFSLEMWPSCGDMGFSSRENHASAVSNVGRMAGGGVWGFPRAIRACNPPRDTNNWRPLLPHPPKNREATFRETLCRCVFLPGGAAA
jgi:hypothetical protein